MMLVSVLTLLAAMVAAWGAWVAVSILKDIRKGVLGEED
jgi:hypothetical protein